MAKGTPPAAAPFPTAIGYYWVKVARTRSVDHRGGTSIPWNGYQTWDDHETSWEIVEVITLERREVGVMCDDQEMSWESRYKIVVAVSPRLEPPEE